jgi:hypothetical protein
MACIFALIQRRGNIFLTACDIAIFWSSYLISAPYGLQFNSLPTCHSATTRFHSLSTVATKLKIKYPNLLTQ